VDPPTPVTTTAVMDYVNAGVVDYVNAAPLNWWIP
jgi:hypothetical protein